jgi:hypothetical protein
MSGGGLLLRVRPRRILTADVAAKPLRTAQRPAIR